MWPDGYFTVNGKLCCHCELCGSTYFEISNTFAVCEHLQKIKPTSFDGLPEVAPYKYTPLEKEKI
jgi:hypothetical protein